MHTQADMEAAIVAHFTNVFGQPGPGAYTLDFDELGVVPADLAELDRPFTEDEVRAVVSDLPSNRAPGPDNFTSIFYKSAWPVIKDDVVSALNALFFSDSRSFRRLNNAFVVLLPKKSDASAPADYRPITMIHSFVKLASKLMAMHLAPRLPELISANQNAFIRGRTIHDNFKFV